MAKSRKRSKRSRRSRRKSRKQRGGSHHEESPAPEAPVAEESPVVEDVPADEGHVGGKRKSRKSKKGGKKSRKSRKGKKLNNFFKLMLDAKKKKLPSFKYNGKTYKGRLLKDKPHLGMVYKRA
tara:strand:+ start:371 stop:739 length:369 start_codon:yes stop_codon:yes gene_type:complete